MSSSNVNYTWIHFFPRVVPCLVLSVVKKISDAIFKIEKSGQHELDECATIKRISKKNLISKWNSLNAQTMGSDHCDWERRSIQGISSIMK